MFSTTTVTVYRASGSTNEYGDETDDNRTVLYSNVPAAVVEDGQVRFATPELRNELIEQFTVRIPRKFDITEGDRLKDDCTGAIYQVNGVSAPQALVMATSTRLITKRIGTEL